MKYFYSSFSARASSNQSQTLQELSYGLICCLFQHFDMNVKIRENISFDASSSIYHLTNVSWVSVRMSRYDHEALGKFGKHERGVGVVRGAAESNSSLLSSLQTSKCFISQHTHNWSMKQLFYNIFNVYWTICCFWLSYVCKCFYPQTEGKFTEVA